MKFAVNEIFYIGNVPVHVFALFERAKYVCIQGVQKNAILPFSHFFFEQA